MTTETEPVSEKKRKSLLEKYDVPIQHLDFAYIRDCKDIVEIERIIKILRSNEEGSYPDLLKCAEECLCVLSPENKLLRTTEPVLTKNQLDPEEWKSVQQDILNWKEEVESVENKLSQSETISPSEDMYPKIRKIVKTISNSVDAGEDKIDASKRVISTDYKKWDSYDADSECLKLDLEEEKRKEEKRREELEEKKKMEAESNLSLEEKEIQIIAGTADGLSEEERKILAVKEKNLGNEFYQCHRLDQALRHYTRSIYLHPTAVAHNNRAATYLKQCKFTKALNDLNIVLEIEPENVKGRFRRAQALQHKNEFEKALVDIQVVLKYEPEHLLARHVADQLRENCASLPKKHRLKVRDENNPSRLIIKEVTEEELKRDYQDKDYVEVNHLGLPRIMCNCNGKYTYDPILKSNDPIRFQHLKMRAKETKPEELPKTEQGERGRVSSCNKKLKPLNGGLVEEEGSGSSTSSTCGKRNKPLVEPAAPAQGAGVLFGGAKRLDIVELEKIEEEDHSPNKQPLVSKGDVVERNQGARTFTSTSTRSCIVSDMRGVKPKKVYFGGYNEDEEYNFDFENESTSTKVEKVSAGPLENSNDNKMDPKKTEGSNSFDYQLPTSGETLNRYVPGIMAQDLSCAIGPSAWDPPPHLRYPTGLRLPKPSPQSPLSNSSVNDEFSSDIDSDDDEFPDDENSSDQIVDIHQVEKMIDNDVDTISKDLFPADNLIKCECGEGYKLRPTQFESKWAALENSPNPLEGRGKLIRLVCPHQFPAVIGNTLDEPRLAGFIACLSYHFDPETEKEKILNYLQSISNLQRFRIIASFLSAKDKAAADELLKKLHPTSSSIEEAFR